MATKGSKATPPKTFTNAIDMLRDEMATSTTRYVQVVGDFMTDYLLEHPEDQDTVLNSGKDIKGSIERMKAEAAKHKEFNVAVLDDETAFGIVLKYYGLKDKREKKGTAVAGGDSLRPAARATSLKEGGQGAAQEAPSQRELSPEATEGVVDPFDLDALMGGL